MSGQQRIDGRICGRREVRAPRRPSLIARAHDGIDMGVDDLSASGVSLKELSAAEYSRLSALWDESIEMAPGKRDAWLAALERSDPKAAALLRALSASQDESRERRFLETSDLLASHVAALVEEDSGLIGKQFGPYRVLSLLGHGGMGSVWLAERADGLFRRQVALKLIHPALKSRVMSERFTREREILASLNHPNIARLLDAGFAEDGQSYLALDYIAGTPLTTYCDEHCLAIRQRLELFRQVLSAVQYAHAHLVIHRDLKPANILVTQEGQVQLLDFGIAKLLSEGEAKETELTQLGGRALTPDYAAPEQIAGAPITTAADVYGLGVMLYELLTGERPYKPKRDSHGALEEAILQADPAAPSRAGSSEAAAALRATTAKKLSNTLRGDLDTIATKALKKSPAERYATANAFGEDIERFLRGDVVLAQPDSVAYRTLKFARRHWAGIGAICVLLLTLAGGLAATSYEARIAGEQRDAAAVQRDAALQAQSRLLTEAAAQHLKNSDVPGAQGIILEVLTNPEFSRIRTQAAIGVFQDVRAADAELAVLSGHGDRVYSAAFSPDGTRIVTASYDKTARIWDAHTGAQLAVLSGHGTGVASAAYSPDGMRIVTASFDKTARIWDARTGAQLTVLLGHGKGLYTAAYSPDGTHIVTASIDKTTASDDKTAQIWEGRVPATLDDQIAWSAAAQTDILSDLERTELGLPTDARKTADSTQGSACDQAAAAFYDPDRRAGGAAQPDINADVADPTCAAEAAKPAHAVRLDYQWGRALWAKHDLTGARRQFELAVSKGSPAARIDLGNLLLDGTAGVVDPQRAVSLYEEAWRDGVPIAAFALGHLYEAGVPGAGVKFQPDPAQAWAWYQKGADAGEPTALARFGERDEQSALSVEDPPKAHALLLRAFRFYAEAAERAHDEAWPDEAWRHWRYRRATLARLLAREGMMGQVADAHTALREQMISRTPSLWKTIKAKLQR